mmetsp:Transcript_9254/g.27375  ORF Transcript_9254/g.27375 Transcript_9254/m.27375 type:complete len:366 (-) Transcript_9254:130-1227(-)
MIPADGLRMSATDSFSTWRRPRLLERTQLQGSLFAVRGTGRREGMRLLRKAPASCVTFDQAGNLTRFWISLRDIYNPGEPDGAAPYVADGADCKNSSTANYSIIAPTYIGHKDFFNSLVLSVKRHTPDVPVQFVSTFSSVEEAQDIIDSCSSCFTESSIEMRTLIFNVPYRHKHRRNHLAASKLWAVSTVEAEHVLMLDSDFMFLRPINMAEVVQEYGRVLFKAASPAREDQQVLGSVNGILNTSYDFFPMELPWLYARSKASQLISFLQRKWGKRSWARALARHADPVVDIVLYNLFVLDTDRDFFTTQIDTRPVVGDALVFRAGLQDSMRAAMLVPPPGTTCGSQRREACKSCWLQAHNDLCE